MRYGVLVVYDPTPEALTRYPDRKFRGGADWLTVDYEPVLFDCPVAAAKVAGVEQTRRVDSLFVSHYQVAEFIASTDKGEIMSCQGPDLSGLGGFLRPLGTRVPTIAKRLAELERIPFVRTPDEKIGPECFGGTDYP